MNQVNPSISRVLPKTGGDDLRVEALVKSYGAFRAIDHVDLTVPSGQFLTLLGPSGSGKTSLLMAIAGFVKPDKGAIRLGSADITSCPPDKRNFGMMFQGYALFQHMTVEGNVGFPLRVRGVESAVMEREICKALEMVDLLPLRRRFPRELSGGQQQRVALARSLVFKPDVLLLDEPLSALDRSLRTQLQWELKEAHKRTGMTFIYVTHDQEEALSMSDSIAVLQRGRIAQLGSPSELYNQPKTKFVASFLGGANFLSARVVEIRPDRVVFQIGEEKFLHGRNEPCAVGENIELALRPERIRLATAPEKTGNCTKVDVVDVKYLGSCFRVRVSHPAIGLIDLDVAADGKLPEQGTSAYICWKPEASVLVRAD